MADKYYLNDALKARAAQAKEKTDDGEIALDDVSRVKVLSPGRQVFKRFIRNRLAVFGSGLLVFMFVFSFIGPLFYSYGQKQIFYKFDRQTVNYAMAKNNTAYNGYDIDPSVNVERAVNNAMNSRIKSMIADGVNRRIEIREENAYEIERLEQDIYRVSSIDLTEVCSVGSSTVNVGSYSQVRRTTEFRGAAVEGLDEAMAEAIRQNPMGGSFTLDGVTYTYKRGQAKNYPITATFDGLHYVSEPLGEEFEAALEYAAEKGEDFTFGGAEYLLVENGGAYNVYRRGATHPARVFTRLAVDTFTVGAPVSNELRVNALLAAGSSGQFTADGAEWTVTDEEGVWVVRGADGTWWLLACAIKDACEYTFKNFIWRLKDSTESLIDQTGAKNFCWKVVGGEITYFETDGISTIVANKKSSAATYNLAGQRVAKTYKGIVVKDGKKYIAK